MGDGNFRPPQNPHPLTDQQNWYMWLRLWPVRLCQIWCKFVDDGVWANGWNITHFFIYTFFMNSPTGQTRRQIFTLDGSNNADSRKDVPFGGLVDTAPHFWGKSSENPIFGAWIGVFKPNGQNIESFMLSKLLHRFQPNFAQRWRPSSGSRKIAISLQPCDRFWWNLAHIGSLQGIVSKNSNFWKSNMAAAAILKITKIAISPQLFDRSLRNLVWWCKMGLLTSPTVNKLNFKSQRWRTNAILKTVKSPYLCNLLTDSD